MASSKRTAAINLDSLKQKNAGKVQFSAVREEIFALLDKGYSRRTLHAVLREEGLFTGSYRRFCEYAAQGIEKRDHGKETPKPAFAPLEKATPPVPVPTPTAPPTSPALIAPTTPPPTAPPAPRQEKPASGGFVHSTPNHSDLF